jgi:hypothetical protein
MDNRQRWIDEEEMLRVAIDGLLTQVWTSLPGYVVAYDASTNTATVQLGVQGQVAGPDQAPQSVNYPVLSGVPVIFPRGGGATLTFPIASGDECWVSFACRAIGGWKQSGGIQPPNDSRRHDLSDAVCHIGPMSQAKVLGSISTSTVQLRSDDGITYLELDPVAKKVNIVAPGGFNVTGPMNVNGNTAFVGQVTANGKHIDDTHTHKNTQPGTGSSGTVN